MINVGSNALLCWTSTRPPDFGRNLAERFPLLICGLIVKVASRFIELGYEERPRYGMGCWVEHAHQGAVQRNKVTDPDAESCFEWTVLFGFMLMIQILVSRGVSRRSEHRPCRHVHKSWRFRIPGQAVCCPNG